tara:strand:+ start:198 stop:356 length:159 start_codon:yes stop_codon:yes gene_type:complete
MVKSKKVVMAGKTYVNEHRSLINLLRTNSAKLLKEANKQENELNNWLKKKNR